MKFPLPALATLLAVALPLVAPAQPPAGDFDSWPAGSSPREIGSRLTELFLSKPFLIHKTSRMIHYAETCAWQGALRFANNTGDTALTERLIRRFDPLLGADAKYLNKPLNVDTSVFGSVPLEIAMRTGDKRYLDIGLALADAQWATPADQTQLNDTARAAAAAGLSWHTRYWIDDMYMITMLQTQAYHATGNKIYLDRAAREAVAYLDKLQQPNGLFHHSENAPCFWGRGNGWFAAGMSELLRALPAGHPDRDRIMAGYKKMMAALLATQDAAGKWHQLIDDPASWPESSCTAMFTYAFITGVKNGWLDVATYGPAARKGWLALVSWLNPDGQIRDVCGGTNPLNDRAYYLARPRVTGDLHGQAPVLWCAAALCPDANARATSTASTSSPAAPLASFGPESLWYDKPAEKWVEALPIGNGRLAAMVFGDPRREHLQLNEDTLYSGEPPSDLRSINIRPDRDKVIALIRAGKYAEADAFIAGNWLGRGQPCYEPLGDLFIEYDYPNTTFAARSGSSPIQNPESKIQNSPVPADFRRWLDLATATAGVSFTRDGVTCTREVFASAPDQVIVVRLTANKPGALAFRATFASPHPTARAAVDEATGALLMNGQLPGYVMRRDAAWFKTRPPSEKLKYPEFFDPKTGQPLYPGKTALYAGEIDGKGEYFQSRLLIKTDGHLATTAGALTVTGAQEAILLIAAASSYNGYDKSPSRDGADPSIRARRDLAAASQKTYAELLSRHIADYRALYDRVTLRLDGARADDTAAAAQKPTDARIAAFAQSPDPALAALCFQFGRYLLIAGSRPGTQPLNLQGKWNDQVLPAWGGGYTVNINAEMNYWPAEVVALPETHEPLFDMLAELAQTGALCARDMYGNRGWVAHHNTTLWRDAYPVDGNTRASWWNMAAGWLCRHLWEHYLYSGDRDFLAAKAYPLMRGAAEFYADWLVPENADGTGPLVTPVSTNPENVFNNSNGKKTAAASMGSTMDMSIIRELFTNTIAAQKILDRDPALRAELEAKLARLAPYRIGSRGQIQEWNKDFLEHDLTHRHLSHLYGLYPGNQIDPCATPALYRAAARSLEIRGDAATGWSMGWKINLWARMLDGDHACKIIQNLFRPVTITEISTTAGGGLYPNMFDAHPPFQIDGNLGYTAGVAEMLVQSHAGAIHLLPALPHAWPSGKVTGLRLRGGFELENMEWQNCRLLRATLRSTLGGVCRLRTRAAVAITDSATGNTVAAAPATGENPNPLFARTAAGEPQIAPLAAGVTTPAPALPAAITVDFTTQPGGIYEIVPAQ